MGTANRREPVRTCVGCRGRFAQRVLVRFVRDADAREREPAWERDPPGKRRPGRGAYLCSAPCGARVAKNRRYPGLSAAAGKADAATDWPQAAPVCMIERL
jgi:predicted RNA-binding protein YlxR (DUF448 family)